MTRPATYPAAPPPEVTAQAPEGLLQRLAQVAALDALPEPDRLLERLLCRIEETVLPRRLTLLLAGEQVAELHIARRALVAVIWQGQRWPAATARNATEAAQSLAPALLRLTQSLSPQGRPDVRSEACRIAVGPGQCPAAVLRRWLSRPTSEIAADLLGQATAQALASCRRAAPSAPLQHRDPVSEFSALLEATLAQVSPGTRQTAAGVNLHPQRACLRVTDLTPEISLAVTELGAEVTALILSPQQAQALARNWAALPC